MAPGGTHPPFSGSISSPVSSIGQASGARGVRVTENTAEGYGRRPARIRLHCGGGFRRRAQRRGEQPGHERPHLWTPAPDPRVCSGVAHVPAACLRSRDDLRMPMPKQNSIQGPIANARDNLARDASRFSQSIVRRNDAVIHRRSDVSHLSSWLPQIPRPSRMNSQAEPRRCQRPQAVRNARSKRSGELRIDLKGNLAAMLSAATNAKRSPETGDLSLQVEMVAGACNPLNLDFSWAAA